MSGLNFTNVCSAAERGEEKRELKRLAELREQLSIASSTMDGHCAAAERGAWKRAERAAKLESERLSQLQAQLTISPSSTMDGHCAAAERGAERRALLKGF